METWNHTSSIVSTILNARQGVKRRHMVSAAKVHPLAKSIKTRLSREATAQRLTEGFGIDNTRKRRRRYAKRTIA